MLTHIKRIWMGALTLAKSIDVRSKSSFRTPFQRPDYCVSIGLFGAMERARTLALDERQHISHKRYRYKTTHAACYVPASFCTREIADEPL